MERRSTPLIEFDNVTIHREGVAALREVSFTVHAGQHTAILGPNGSGKSTLIKAVTRELYPRYPPPASRLRIWGREVWHLFELRALLGIVTNDLVETCVKPYSALETALSGFFGSIGIWPNHRVTPAMEERARAALEFFDMAHLAERPLTEMSSGEVRRAVFARALVHDPQALILDEPTNSLDIRAQREVRDSMRKLAAGGVTLILVTHHLPDIIPEIERVVTLRQGRIHSDGAKAAALSEESLAELFGVDVRVMEAGGYFHLW
ncbi:MAG: ATP-binding cassette domain-containing protein [Acidobacteria bacterium]|nr:ATP-binding cassette domain-containing protein [Acidobacteriota bacterium]